MHPFGVAFGMGLYLDHGTADPDAGAGVFLILSTDLADRSGAEPDGGVYHFLRCTWFTGLRGFHDLVGDYGELSLDPGGRILSSPAARVLTLNMP